MHRFLVVGLLGAVMLAGCGGDNPLSSNATSSTGSSSNGNSSTTSTALAISGSPATQVVVGQRYTFQPAASGPSSGALTFSVQNAPSWTTASITSAPRASRLMICSAAAPCTSCQSLATLSSPN